MGDDREPYLGFIIEKREAGWGVSVFDELALGHEEAANDIHRSHPHATSILTVNTQSNSAREWKVKTTIEAVN